MALISIIIPAFGAQETIEQAVRSSLAASREHKIEVIVVDDASTDQTSEIVRGMVGREAGNIALLRSPSNIGAGGCRNLGMTAASGDWLMFLDADDVIQPSSLDAPLSREGISAVDFVIFPYHYVTGTRTLRSAGMLPEDTKLWADVLPASGKGPVEAARLGRLVAMTNYPWNKLIRRAYAVKIDLRYTEVPVNNDIAAHWQLFSRASKIMTHDEATVFHFVSRNNIQITNVFDERRLSVFVALADARRHVFYSDQSIDTYFHHFINFEVRLFRWIYKRLPPELHEAFCLRVREEFLSLGTPALNLLARKMPNLGATCINLAVDPEYYLKY